MRAQSIIKIKKYAYIYIKYTNVQVAGLIALQSFRKLFVSHLIPAHGDIMPQVIEREFHFHRGNNKEGWEGRSGSAQEKHEHSLGSRHVA